MGQKSGLEDRLFIHDLIHFFIGRCGIMLLYSLDGIIHQLRGLFYAPTILLTELNASCSECVKGLRFDPCCIKIFLEAVIGLPAGKVALWILWGWEQIFYPACDIYLLS